MNHYHTDSSLVAIDPFSSMDFIDQSDRRETKKHQETHPSMSTRGSCGSAVLADDTVDEPCIATHTSEHSRVSSKDTALLSSKTHHPDLDEPPV